MNYERIEDHLNHQEIITYQGLTRVIDYTKVSDEYILKLVNEMKEELRELFSKWSIIF